jgi:CHAD domain-containing protein
VERRRQLWVIRRPRSRPTVAAVAEWSLDLTIPGLADRHSAAPTTGRLQEILRNQLRALDVHAPGVRSGVDAEDVHKFRVATRRLRAVGRAAGPVAGPALAGTLADLKWLARALGRVRDLDVMLDRLREAVAEPGCDNEAGNELVAILTAQREASRRALLKVLDSRRYAALVNRLAVAVERLPPLRDDELRPLAQSDLRSLDAAAERLQQLRRETDLHALRIRAKRARYTAELLVRDAPLKHYLAELTRLQDIVGVYQDAVVFEERLRGIATDRTRSTVDRLAARERERRAASLASYEDVLGEALTAGTEALS